MDTWSWYSRRYKCVTGHLGNLTLTTNYNARYVSRRFSKRPWYHSGRAGPFMLKNDPLILEFSCTLKFYSVLGKDKQGLSDLKNYTLIS
ncbi:unnamed protein product [Spodoptera littoralis]|uniref:Uncharacterized protein n=1 Tax=Spodoptera littoralis TaxID=7109 RepID=A0A9P0MZB1_SPOLI|nr:unnamed protein product [Spodoptera littoralis]CAH1635868.1 unnamed protein product [Spodoptera littoralis]